ncbi:TraR/DksA family transcriptional regulator [Kaarinaea lacus]
MNEEDQLNVEEFKAILLATRDLLRQVEATGKESTGVVELDQSKVGRLSRMDALQGQAMSLEAQRRRAIELQKIQAALTRLEREEFGYCVKCGEFIGLGRLRVDPAAPCCVKCAD